MDLQKEREAFEAWASEDVENFIDAVFDGKYYVMRENSRLNQKDKEFLILSLNRGWKAWQAAQAIPDGFVLVPKEPTSEMLYRGYAAPDNLSAKYKAMIEAQEQAK